MTVAVKKLEVVSTTSKKLGNASKARGRWLTKRAFFKIFRR